MKKQRASYTATCPMCLSQHDFSSRKAADDAWREWRAPGALLSKIAWQINPENPIAAAEAMPEIWRLINEALPYLKREVQVRESEGLVGYIKPMRQFADQIERIIRKATKGVE